MKVIGQIIKQMDLVFIKVMSNDVIYEGKWKDDRQEGIGTEKWNNGTSYTGEFKMEQKTGKSKFKYIDGANYSGNF